MKIRTLTCLSILVLSACGTSYEPAGMSAAELAEKGGEAFYQSLSGESDRVEETIELLSEAVAKDPQDGTSHFRLGMIRLFRFSQGWLDYNNATLQQKEDVREAQASLDIAVPLLPMDRRVPGFRGAVTYVRGFIQHDSSVIALGLQQMRDAITLYPEFNSFDFIGVVAPTVAPGDPLFAEVLRYVGDPLNGGCSPFEQPEICGNGGKAAHNLEGSLILFGDIFAKAGDASKARGFYRLAGTPFPGGTGKPWRFQSVIASRLSSLSERVALYKDADSSNDPPLFGYGAEACAGCHFK